MKPRLITADKKVTKVLKAVEKGYGKIFDDPVGTYFSPGSPLEKAGQLAQSYGFQVCGA
ncbi:MAG: hypothetical protein WD598_01275 [Acidimicrobiia bacterium]